MRIVVLQPMLWPWIGHFEQVRLADRFVHYDDVQLVRRSPMRRVRIKTAAGGQWLAVPVRGPSRPTLAEARLVEDGWRGRHVRALEHAYARAPYRDEVLEIVSRTYAAGDERLADLTIRGIGAICDHLGLAAPVLRSSDLGVPGRSWRRLLAIVRSLGGSVYVTGHGAAHYLDHEAFERAGVEVRYMDYQRLPYPQLHGAFDPHVSVLDLIANTGSRAREWLVSSTVPWRCFLSGRS